MVKITVYILAVALAISAVAALPHPDLPETNGKLTIDDIDTTLHANHDTSESIDMPLDPFSY
ncbi:hypothetical protein BC936DRAFT_148833 [Jimgerdemannia flammicorona]|uniref:Uncharacterized protein n=2 Tax=Jimgerdemannia flammicorona TaxID=994334 RepID=A0A433D269_9FUNG|nr:hypothetical protein BC936DRAFT_148833 [Jimgerdemannia flammicorona]RUS24074.1 hypothetical protein BC938DRAFT_474173 [Jimgerdemannia flammicorona]